MDCINNRILEKEEPIPENAIVVPDPDLLAKIYLVANEHGLQVKCALIIKYRDEKSNASLELEDFLR